MSEGALTGKRFDLIADTIAIDYIDGKEVAVTVPAGSIIEVLSRPRRRAGMRHKMVDVLWQQRKVTMFAVDVENRSIERRFDGHPSSRP